MKFVYSLILFPKIFAVKEAVDINYISNFRPIMRLSSALFYENKLRCANNAVAEAVFTNLTPDPITDGVYSSTLN